MLAASWGIESAATIAPGSGYCTEIVVPLADRRTDNGRRTVGQGSSRTAGSGAGLRLHVASRSLRLALYRGHSELAVQPRCCEMAERSISYGPTPSTTSSVRRLSARCHCGPTMRWLGRAALGVHAGAPHVGLGTERSRPARLTAFNRDRASEERRIVTLRSMRRNPNDGQDHGQLLGELTCQLNDDAMPEYITERAGSVMYRYFAQPSSTPPAAGAVRSKTRRPAGMAQLEVGVGIE
jgi:hypothetical protein